LLSQEKGKVIKTNFSKSEPIKNMRRSLSKVKRKCSLFNITGHVQTERFLNRNRVKKTNHQGPNSSWEAENALTQNEGPFSKCKEKALVF